MRWINIADYSPSQQWLAKADEVTLMLKSAKTKKERKEIIDEYSYMWGELKDELLELSAGKCWYSEAKKTVSYFDVDHFRPKNNVKLFNRFVETSGNDEGYWWLAFDWRNYRPSGEIMNRKKSDKNGDCRGKQDYFPLVKGSKIAQSHNDDINKEIAYLLDPTCYDDSCLIVFDNTGKPYPAVEQGTFEYMRVKLTCFILHLDFQPLVDQRVMVWNECKRLMNEVANLMKERDAVSIVIEKERKQKINRLRELVSIKSEFSSTAICCLLDSGYPWAQRIIAST